jgi:hypothetical protein
VIDPTTVAVVSAEYGPYDALMRDRNQEKITLGTEFAIDNELWSIPRRVIGEDQIPQGHDIGSICGSVLADSSSLHRSAPYS